MKMNNIKQILGLITLSIIAGCVEPADIGITRSEIIVVDGKVTTQLGDSRVILYGLDSDGIQIPLTDYEVSVSSSDGTEYPFLETEEPGEYRPAANFSGVIGEQYRLTAISTGGSVIVSSFDSIEEPNPFSLETVDTVRTESQEFGITITKEAKAAIAVFDVPDVDYQARFTFQYVYENPLTLTTTVEVDEEAFELFTCIDEEVCQQQQSITMSLVDFRDWTFLNPDSCDFTLDPPPPCMLPCCQNFLDYPTIFTIRQESLSSEAYDFWREVELLRNNDGLVFDTYPFPINGNVSCDNCNLEVIGFFSAVAVLEESQLVVL